MPVNSFENYPMSFKPDKNLLEPPYYLSLADLLEEQIVNGLLEPNIQLPPQRELADYLDLSLSTVTRAYALCEKKGLTYALTGKGTFVSPNVGIPIAASDGGREKVLVDMSTVGPFPQFNGEIAQAVHSIYQSADFERLITYWTPSAAEHRHMVSEWLSKQGIELSSNELFMAYGAQNALALILSSVFEAGNRLAVDAYTYSNFIWLAQQMHIQLVPVAGDADGMLPEELDRLCQKQKLDGVYLTPVCQNPLGITMSAQRRRELSAVIKRHRLIVIEDDVYGFLDREKAPNFSALLPEDTLYLNSISKMLCGGLRTSFLVVPQRFQKQIHAAESGINMAMSPILSELSARLVCSPVVEEIVERKRRLSIQRNRLFDDLFGASPVPHSVSPFFRWLRLPERWQKVTGRNFELCAKQAGVRVYHSDHFTVGGNTPVHVRVSISSAGSAQEYRRGLELLHRFLYETDSPMFG